MGGTLETLVVEEFEAAYPGSTSPRRLHVRNHERKSSLATLLPPMSCSGRG